jgi:hypothetical protein
MLAIIVAKDAAGYGCALRFGWFWGFCRGFSGGTFGGDLVVRKLLYKATF